MTDANVPEASLDAQSRAPQNEGLLQAVGPPVARSKSDKVMKLLSRAKGATPWPGYRVPQAGSHTVCEPFCPAFERGGQPSPRNNANRGRPHTG